MSSSPPPQPLVSLDAYRGFIMLAMASSGFAFAQVHKNQKLDDPLWNFLAFQFDHVPWVGCSFWDLIQPSFMFMVGVALPFSLASRADRGDSGANRLFHAVRRAVILILLAVFLSSPGPAREYPTTNWAFTNVLAQIGLGYVFVYLLVGRGLALQLTAITVILTAYTLFFGLYPAPGPDFDWKAVGVPDDWPHLTGWFSHWDKNSNAAHFFDVWFLNLFPRAQPFLFERGGYETLNFIPSMATMIFGLIAGELLVSPLDRAAKFTRLALAAVVCLALGMVLGEVACPIVKRIWSPSWAVYSAGWTFAMLAVFYGVIDVLGWKSWSFPLVVVGMNSIAIYLMSQQMRPWLRRSLNIHLGTQWFTGFYGPIVETSAILFLLWLICFWMYRRRIFLRI